MGNEISIVKDGATITIAPISLVLTNQLLMSFEGCKLHATFGIDFNTMTDTPGDEFGSLRLSFNDSMTLSLDTLYQLFGIAFPVGVTGGEHIRISENLFIFMVLDRITKPEHTYRLHIHVDTPPFLSCEKPRIPLEEDSEPAEEGNNG